MAQPPGGRVIAADEAARLAAGRLAFPDAVLVQAVIAEFMAGDSCVLIRTGTRNNGSRFWVPTKHIYLQAALVPDAKPVGQGEIPDYNVVDALKHVDAPFWDWTPRPIKRQTPIA